MTHASLTIATALALAAGVFAPGPAATETVGRGHPAMLPLVQTETLPTFDVFDPSRMDEMPGQAI